MEQKILFSDIQIGYNLIKNTMDFIYNNYGYANKKILVEQVIESCYDEDRYKVMQGVFDDMWFRLPDRIFNIFTPMGREFLGFTELLSEFSQQLYEEKQNENKCKII